MMILLSKVLAMLLYCGIDTTLLNEKENKILDLSHRLETLSEVSESSLNDINNQIISIHTALINITSSHKTKNHCSEVSSHEDIDEINFLREELKIKAPLLIFY